MDSRAGIASAKAADKTNDDAFLFGGQEGKKQPTVQATKEVVRSDKLSADEWFQQAQREQKKAQGGKPRRLEVIDISTLADNFLAPGRNRCTCQARRHRLLGNCMSCGRVICEQEGWGPCFFCGEPFMKKGKELKNKDGADAAAQHKDKLLAFQNNSAQRTKVVDDQMVIQEYTRTKNKLHIVGNDCQLPS